MKFLSHAGLAFSLLIGLFFFSCNSPSDSKAPQPQANSQEEEIALEDQADLTEIDSTPNFDEIPDHASDAELISLHAKFIEFELGDASHFVFEDESGEVWDFGGCEDPNCDFAMALSEEESDESNQGWGSNPEAVGKWFDLRYYETERELYIDGPVGTVQVIAEVAPAE